jgi:hypothetical protein
MRVIRMALGMTATVGAVCWFAVAGAPGSAAAGRQSTASATGPQSHTEGSSRTRIIGGSAAQRSLLRTILAALGPTGVAKVRVVPVRGGVSLDAPVQAPRASWQFLVVGVAFFTRSADQHLPPVGELDAGHVGWPTSNTSNWSRPPRATRASVRSARRMMRRLALAAGAGAFEVTVSAPDALVVSLQLRVQNAARFLQNRLRTLVLGAEAHASRYDGLFIEVDDAHGVAWASGDTPLGGLDYVRPSLSGCNPFPPPGPSGSSYPTTTVLGCVWEEAR